MYVLFNLMPLHISDTRNTRLTGLSLFLLAFLIVLPVAAAYTIIPFGGTVFHGEEGLNISAPMNNSGGVTLTWFPPGGHGNEEFSQTVYVGREQSFDVDPSMETGNWYFWCSIDGNRTHPAIVVAEPRIDIKVLHGDTNVNNGDVVKGVKLRFKINSNLNTFTERTNVTGSHAPGAPATITIRDPDGNPMTEVKNATGRDFDLSASGGFTDIDEPEFDVADGATIWDTGLKNYQDGEYRFSVTCTANNMEVRSDTYSVTLISPGMELVPYIQKSWTENKPYDVHIAANQTKRFALWFTFPSYGDIAGYNITMILTPQKEINFTDFTFPDWVAFDENTNLPNSSVTIRAGSIEGKASDGDGRVHLLDLEIQAGKAQEGTAEITIGGDSVQDRQGSNYRPGTTARVTKTTIRVTEVLPFLRPPPRETELFPPPQKSDNYYYDLDGNGYIGFNDVVIFYNNMNAIRVGDHGDRTFFDYDDNGFIGYNDIVTLYNKIQPAP